MATAFFVIILISLVVGLVYLMRTDSNTPENNVDESITNYMNALEALKKNPTDDTLYNEALRLGRLYATVSNQQFDETEFENHVRPWDDATISTQHSESPHATMRSSHSINERIDALIMLKESGLLSDEELAQKRKEILDSI